MMIHLPAKATFISITPRQRQQIEGLIESLIAMLDTIDGNENDEDDGCDEPVLGWSATHSFGDPRIDEGEVDGDFELDHAEFALATLRSVAREDAFIPFEDPEFR
jgi:hypothetical protein